MNKYECLLRAYCGRITSLETRAHNHPHSSRKVLDAGLGLGQRPFFWRSCPAALAVTGRVPHYWTPAASLVLTFPLVKRTGLCR